MMVENGGKSTGPKATAGGLWVVLSKFVACFGIASRAFGNLSYQCIPSCRLGSEIWGLYIFSEPNETCSTERKSMRGRM